MTGRNEALSDVADLDLQQWLTNGVLAMSGLDGNVSSAFEPYAGHIGCSREFSWADELIAFALGLDVESRHSFDRAAVASLIALVKSDIAKNWLAVLHFLYLVRYIRARGAGQALVVLYEELALAAPKISSAIHHQLLASALLLATSTEGRDRKLARDVALKIAPQILQVNREIGSRARASFMSRLSVFSFTAEELALIGFEKSEIQNKELTDIRNLLTHGALPTYAEYL